MTVILWATQGTNPAVPGTFGISTPIVVSAGGLIIANADGPSGLTLTATIQTPDGTIVVNTPAITITEDTSLGGGRSRYTARAVAPMTPGSYQIAWVNNAQLAATEPITVAIGTRPALTDVAALVRARTKVRGGAELGTFSSATRPTDSEVETFIDLAVDEVGGKVQPVDYTLPAGETMGAGSDYETRYRGAVALYAAILIELSLFPEQVRNNQSPVATYQQLYDSRIRALISEGETGRPEGMGEGAAGGGDAPADAAWSFPDAMPGALVGWSSRW